MNRVTKTRSSKPRSEKSKQKEALLAAVLSGNKWAEMPCTYCESRGLSCQVSDSDSARCSTCIRLNQSNCDVRGLTPQQLDRVAAQHHRLEVELEEAAEAVAAANAKFLRLQKQKRLWYEKMMRAVRRGLDNVEELERVEREEAEKEAAVAEPAGPLPEAFPDSLLQEFDNIDWSNVPTDFGNLELSLGSSSGVGNS